MIFVGKNISPSDLNRSMDKIDVRKGKLSTFIFYLSSIASNNATNFLENTGLVTRSTFSLLSSLRSSRIKPHGRGKSNGGVS